MTMKTKLEKFEHLEFSINTGYPTAFWYSGLLYTIEELKDGWYIWANKIEHDDCPVFEEKFNEVSEIFSYDFSDGKTLKDIWQDIEPYSMTY